MTIPLLMASLLAAGAPAETPPAEQAAVAYRLPADGVLPKTYQVSLAIVEATNSDWIVSQFVCGQPRTVTTENQGHFVDTWNGLDDNFMPVPPGTYAVKGIFLPAEKWAVDGEYHAITPRFVGGPSAWLPSPDQWRVPEPFGGDPCGQPLGDVDVGTNGVAVFYYVYLENGRNNPMLDLTKPVNGDQVLRAFASGGAGGGNCTCTDGQTVWSFSTDGGPKYVYRADGKPFGTGRAQRPNVYRPEGWVTALAAWRDPAGGRSRVYMAQRGRIVENRDHYTESTQDFVDSIAVLDGANGAVLAEIPTRRPQALVARHGALRILQAAQAGGHEVVSFPLEGGLPKGEPTRLFAVPAEIHPGDLEEDSHGRLYLSDTPANKVHQFDARGKLLRSFGRLTRQLPGRYDPLTFMTPGKLATWTDADGHDRLIVVEQAGPNRASEWGSDDGRLLREFQSLQTKANDGYAVDPDHPDHIYIGGHQGWLTRFRVDYTQHVWRVDAVWPDVGNDPLAPGFDHPRFIRRGGHAYLAGARSYNVYRLAGDRWQLAAAIVRRRVDNRPQCWLWNDVDGDGRIQEAEYLERPLATPGWLLRYHGEQWLEDLSLLAMNQGGRDIWRLAPVRFDAHGNPVFAAWERVLTDPILESRARGTPDALHGGNELDDRFSSDWAMADGSLQEGFYVNARGGRNFSANEGAQVKLSRYVPDGRGGYALRWRTGRAALQGVAQPGEIYGAIHISKPINGLVSVIDQSRCGIVLYTEDGLYVDTVFPDGRRHPRTEAGVYPQPGEFFAGCVYPNRDNGRIYFAMGKISPLLFEAQGWSLRENPVRSLATLPKTVTLTARQIAAPPEIAVSLRGGAGQARVARFAPALGGAVLDGSMAGWESCDAVRFQADTDQTVEVRGLYAPDHLFLRWHARLGRTFEPRPLQPVERLFTHDRLADTLSFYVQGDPSALPHGPAAGRPGDVRFVFGIFQDGAVVRPVALGLYPAWRGDGQASPMTYRTPVGRADFAHVGLVGGVELRHVVDADGKGFVLAAAIPRRAIPGLPPLSDAVRTMVNFEATLGGHSKFWWSNADGSASRETYDEPTEARLYPGAWAPAQFGSLAQGVVIRNWLACGPFGGPGAERFVYDLNGKEPGTNRDWKQVGREFSEAAGYPPDGGVDTNAVYTGEMVRGYWRDPRAVRWTPAQIADLDTRIVLGGAAQVWYGATWVFTPAALDLELRLQGHPQTYLRWTVNGEPLAVAPKDYQSEGALHCEVARRTVSLRTGWNQVAFRGYCVGYGPFRVGLVLAGPPESLWKLRLSDRPPSKD